MENAAKLITALGAFLGAIAWPIAILIIILMFRKELKAVAAKLPSFFDRMKKMKIAGIEAELGRIAASAASAADGNITSEQITVAAKIAVEADDYLIDLHRQLDRLCLEYDSIRRTMQAGASRTQAMTGVLVQMRALAPSLVGNIEAYKISGSPGSRLAAVAMMQMNPNACDISWLTERFEVEAPFIFYHAALALQNLANGALSHDEWDRLLGAAQRSLDKVQSFPGVPDQGTVEVLERLISDIRQ